MTLDCFVLVLSSTQVCYIFSSSQWLIGDSAYPLLTTLITSFRSNTQQLDYSKRKDFNLRHERTLGSLKKIKNTYNILRASSDDIEYVGNMVTDNNEEPVELSPHENGHRISEAEAKLRSLHTTMFGDLYF